MAKAINFGRIGSNRSQGGKAAIVFVHGFTGDWKKTWGRIPEFLSAEPTLEGWDMYGFGYESRRRFDILGLWSSDAALPEIAIKLYTISTGEPIKDYRAIAFVAHSMGGLVVQEAITRYDDLRTRTTHVFLFGTPSAGLVKADKLSFVKQQIENMRPESTFIRDLRTRWVAQKLDADPKLRFLTIAGELDQFVPPSSSLQPFAEATKRIVPGNHVTMLDADLASDPSVKILIEGLTGGSALAGPRNSARVAAEIGEFAQLVQRQWPSSSPMPEGLDDASAVNLAMALEKVGRRQDAIKLLEAHRGRGTDVKGVLAGRLKRRWLVTGAEADYQLAKKLYQEAYDQAANAEPRDSDQAYYHGINLAFLELAGAGNYAAALQNAQRLANEVLVHCGKAWNSGYELWRLATEGDALTILGRWNEGLQKHRDVMSKAPKSWLALSIEEQAIRIATLANAPEDHIRALADLYEGQESDVSEISVAVS